MKDRQTDRQAGWLTDSLLHSETFRNVLHSDSLLWLRLLQKCNQMGHWESGATQRLGLNIQTFLHVLPKKKTFHGKTLELLMSHFNQHASDCHLLRIEAQCYSCVHNELKNTD